MSKFKLKLATFVLLFVAITAEAQSSASRSRKSYPKKTGVSVVPTAAPMAPMPEAPKEEPPSATKHFFAGLVYSTANQLNYKGNLELFAIPTEFTATENTTAAFGFAGGYISRQANSFGYSGDLTYELPRPSQGLTGSAGNTIVRGTYDKAPSNSMLTAGLNANFSFGERIYIFAGLNYPFAFLGGEGMSLTGLPGYQLGGGFVFTERFSGEVSYRAMKLKGTIEAPPLSPLHIEEATFNGMVFAVHYLF